MVSLDSPVGVCFGRGFMLELVERGCFSNGNVVLLFPLIIFYAAALDIIA